MVVLRAGRLTRGCPTQHSTSPSALTGLGDDVAAWLHLETHQLRERREPAPHLEGRVLGDRSHGPLLGVGEGVAIDRIELHQDGVFGAGNTGQCGA